MKYFKYKDIGKHAFSKRGEMHTEIFKQFVVSELLQGIASLILKNSVFQRLWKPFESMLQL